MPLPANIEKWEKATPAEVTLAQGLISEYYREHLVPYMVEYQMYEYFVREGVIERGDARVAISREMKASDKSEE